MASNDISSDSSDTEYSTLPPHSPQYPGCSEFYPPACNKWEINSEGSLVGGRWPDPQWQDSVYEERAILRSDKVHSIKEVTTTQASTSTTPDTLNHKTSVTKRLVYSIPPPTQSPLTPEPSSSPAVQYPVRPYPKTWEELITQTELDKYFEEVLGSSDDSDDSDSDDSVTEPKTT